MSTVSAAPRAAAEPPQGPLGDAFYTPPAPLPDGVAGDVIWWRPMADRSNAKQYLVLYRSTSATGQPIAVSGRVVVPKAAWKGTGPRPVVSVAAGTRGIGDGCAPSKYLDYEAPFVDPMLNKGWALALSDYEGLGTPGVHTYVVGQSEGHAVIDAVRAATRLPAAGLAAGGPVAFSGYSQGGGGAAWAGELAPTYAPDLKVVGITAGGTPADLIAVSKLLDGGVGFGFLLLASLGFNAAYPELDLPRYLNAKGQELFATKQDVCVDQVFGYVFQRISDYTTSNPLNDPAWQSRLNENKLGARAPKAPIFLFHGQFDEIIPLEQAQTLRKQYCAAGVKVNWGTYIGEHVTTMAFASGDVVNYLTDRFAGKAAKSNC
ncbi:triacylglycerol lipase [Actinokineospora bangkokensis]|uniref:Triacylglycerol lipase n=2 Tax=Actinokineospora bangkokensis TaxID=1193682 RepID=A0A1Q9LM39_9PSEU|nr:triacylglycerol lipase [Actinokineospora bangkokensis]